MEMFTRLPSAAQALYAELFELSLQLAVERVGVLRGSFVSKEIRSRRYWYHQRTVGGANTQRYLGPDSDALRAWIERQREQDFVPEGHRLAELCAMIAAGGAVRESAAVTGVLGLLRDAGLFSWGGGLVGTVAFATQATMLGVRFPGQTVRTEDIDAAWDRPFGVALAGDAASTDIARALTDSPLRFLPVPEFDPRHPSTSFKVRGRQLRVDFLTPASGGKSDGAPVLLKELGLAAQPLPFLEYLIDGAVQAVVVGPTPVLVNVPDPARTVFHKLWTALQRPVAWATKAQKDLAQAAALLAVLVEDRPGDLERAWLALASHPRQRAQVEQALGQLPAELRARVASSTSWR